MKILGDSRVKAEDFLASFILFASLDSVNLQQETIQLAKDYPELRRTMAYDQRST